MSDDEIQIVDNLDIVDAGVSRRDDICQLCSTKLHGLSDTERKTHYEQHKTGRKTALARLTRGRRKPAPVATSQGKTTPMCSRKSAENAVQDDVFWHPTQAEAPPDNYTPGVLPILKEALKKSCGKGTTRRAVLCYERTPHIYREPFDASWGCGYRNFLITCAALMDQRSQSAYSAHLSSPSLPGVRNLQHWIEDAWKQGYDDIGAHDLDHKLVNTKKKLGTGDLYVAFTSRKIPCMLVDFDFKKSTRGFDALTEWVVNYFTAKPKGDVNKILRTDSPVVATSKMPVILQYDGHSVTIVGYELTRNGKHNLLVFNPSSKVQKETRQAALNALTGADQVLPSSVSLGKTKRPERSMSPAPKKRSRTSQDPDDGVVSLLDSDDDKMDDARRVATLKSTLDPDAVIKSFRFKFSNKQEYQLLYFTMGDPLTDQEQDDRKVVFSVSQH